MKHYEDVWVEAENISSTVYTNVETLASDFEAHTAELFHHILNDSPQRNDVLKELVGNILFDLTFVCKHFNINSWTALNDAINNAKIEAYKNDDI